MPDKEIQCRVCGRSFVWSERRQAAYALKGFVDPSRCDSCRAIGPNDPQPKKIQCAICYKPFVWNTESQKIYEKRRFEPPIRCATCRKEREEGTRTFADGSKRYRIECEECDRVDYVTFVPRGDRPVLCTEHYRIAKKEKEK